MQEFPKSVADRIGYYVYMLVDPDGDQVFYVGKGTGNRVFAHVHEAIEHPRDAEVLHHFLAVSRPNITHLLSPICGILVAAT